jgi:UDP-N-acetylglucosamine 2-epimerase (non-hydrolysing)
MKKLHFAFVFGTRPEIIKLSPLFRLCRRQRISHILIHTGQHYSFEMDRIFFRDLELQNPSYQLKIHARGPYKQNEHTARMMMGIEKILVHEKPSHVLVQGDTNTVLAGSLAASKLSTTFAYTGLRFVIGHVEAGLRSYDHEMPEEHNRVISDHLSDHLFVPTRLARLNLLKEGIKSSRIHVTGNTVVDALRQNLVIARHKADMKTKKLVHKKTYLLATLHRQENVDNATKLHSIVRGLNDTADHVKMPILLPLHPRTRHRLKALKLSFSRRIQVMEPVGYLNFLLMESYAQLILTDSGGVQEEACALRVPCVTIRTTTERPETLRVGANCLAGIKARSIVRSAGKMLRCRKTWKNPFGDGHAAEKILHVLRSHHCA